MRIKGLLATAGMSVASMLQAGAVWASDNGHKLGLPTDGALGLQPAATEIKEQVHWFHDWILLPILIGISLLVLGLLVWIVIRYNKRSNPKPATFSHNTLIEVIWTVVPIVILVFIAVFSMSLLRKYEDMPTPDVVVKVTGNQWYWTYDFPELGVEGIESRLLPDAADLTKSRAQGLQYLLSTDNKLIVPLGQVVHLQVTASDVIHAFAVPAFGVKIDAVPGRLNNIWFKAEKLGTFYGQCSELCGKDHAYMPIEVVVVTPEEFDAYIVEKGGKTRAMIAAEEAEAKAVAEAEAASAAAASDAASSAEAPAADAPVADAAASAETSVAASAAQ